MQVNGKAAENDHLQLPVNELGTKSVCVHRLDLNLYCTCRKTCCTTLYDDDDDG